MACCASHRSCKQSLCFDHDSVPGETTSQCIEATAFLLPRRLHKYSVPFSGAARRHPPPPGGR